MTKQEALIMTAFTGTLFAPISEYQAFAEKLLRRKVQTLELGTRKVEDELREAAREEMERIVRETWGALF